MATVTTVTKVKDGRHIYQYDLYDNKLVIEYRHGKKAPVRVTLNDFALQTLKDILGVPPTMPTIFDSAPVERPPGSVPKAGIQGQQTDEGLTRTGDGIESGMEE